MAQTTEPPNLDPQTSTDTVSFEVLNGVYEGLVRVHDGKVKPGIAETWDISEDGDVYKRQEFDEKDMDKITEKFSLMLDYLGKLNELDTKDVEPLINVNKMINVMREDEVKASLPRDIILNNAPEKMYGCVKVNKIIE